MRRVLCVIAFVCSLGWAQITQPGGGGTSSWSGLTDPSGNLALATGNNTTTFTAGTATGAGVDVWSFLDTANNTGTGYRVNITTAASSAANGLKINRGSSGSGARAWSVQDNSVEKAYCTFAGTCFATTQSFGSLVLNGGGAGSTTLQSPSSSNSPVFETADYPTTRKNYIDDRIRPEVAYFADDFIGGIIATTGSIGEMGWNLANVGGAGTQSAQNGVASHPGIIRMASSATSGQGTTLSLNNGSAQSIEPIQPMDVSTWDSYIVFRNVTSIANIRFYIGFGDTYTAVPTGGNFIGLRIDTNAGVGDTTNYKFVTIKAGAATAHGTVFAAVANTWHQLHLYSDTAGTISLEVDGVAAICFNSGGTGGCTANANIPVVALAPLITIVTDTTAAKDVDMDFFSFRYRGGQRY